MANYIVPQVLINQLISEVQLNTVRNQNVLVIGPNYELFRFAEEKDKTYIGDYVNRTGQEGGGEVVDPTGEKYEAGKNAYANKTSRKDNLKSCDVIPYPNQASATIPDAEYTKVFADEVIVKLASLGGFYLFDDEGTEGVDARFRFPFALTGDKRGFATKLLKLCPDEVDETTGYCGRCDSLADSAYYKCSYDPTRGTPGLPYSEMGQMKVLERSLNPGDVIRIPYGLEDDGVTPKVYQSTIVEIFESEEGSGIFDCVQMADTLPDDFVTDTNFATVDGDYDEDNPHCMRHTVVEFVTAEEDPDIGPVEDDNSNDDDDCEGGDYESSAGKDVLNSVQLCAQFSDVEIPRKTSVRHVWNWNVYSDTSVGAEDVYGVIVTKNLRVRYSNWGEPDDYTGLSKEFRAVSAKLYVQHRDLITSTSDDISSISSHTLVEATLGTVHPDNPLAFGVYMAALNSGDRLVYFCGVPTDDLSGYNTVLGKATLTDDVYMICPTTMDLSVAQAVKAHCLEMSTAQNKLWRIGFVSVEPPKTDMIYDSTNDPDGRDFYARFILTGDRDPGCDGANVLQFMKDFDQKDSSPNTSVKFVTTLKVNDVVRIWLGNDDDDWDDTPHYTERYVSKIISNNTVQLSEPVRQCASAKTLGDSLDCNDDCHPDMAPAGMLETGRYKVEIYRKLDPSQQVKYIAAQSSQLATRRMYNVFPSAASNDGVKFDGSMVACAVAGLVSSVLPQQPLTNVALNGISDIPLTYQTYTRAQLNDIAAGGTFIVMQDRPNSQVYVRHQISTDYTSGNLLKAELSITKNLDSISYYFAELFAPYIGKYNITPQLIDVLDNVLRGGLSDLETGTAAGLYGPQVIEEGTEVLYIRQSEVNRDHVEARVHLNLPVPFNYFDLDLEI